MGRVQSTGTSARSVPWKIQNAVGLCFLQKLSILDDLKKKYKIFIKISNLLFFRRNQDLKHSLNLEIPMLRTPSSLFSSMKLEPFVRKCTRFMMSLNIWSFCWNKLDFNLGEIVQSPWVEPFFSLHLNDFDHNFELIEVRRTDHDLDGRSRDRKGRGRQPGAYPQHSGAESGDHLLLHPWTGVELDNLPTGVELDVLPAGVELDNLPTGVELDNLSAGVELDNLPAGLELDRLPAGSELDNLPDGLELDRLPAGSELDNLPAGAVVQGPPA